MHDEDMHDEDMRDELLHSSIPSKYTYEDEDDASFSGNQHIAHAGYGNLHSHNNNEEDFMSVEPTHQWKTFLQGMPSGILKEAWINIHVADGYDQLVNQVQGQDLRPTETLAMLHARLWKWRDDNGVVHPVQIDKRYRMDRKEEKATQTKETKKRKRKR